MMRQIEELKREFYCDTMFRDRYCLNETCYSASIDRIIGLKLAGENHFDQEVCYLNHWFVLNFEI